MRADVEAAAALHAHGLPYEACGILIWDGAEAISYVPAYNTQASTSGFLLDLPAAEWEQLSALATDRPDLTLGLFHSHVYGEAKPTRADILGLDKEWHGRPYVIFSVRTGRWWLGRIG